MPKATDQVMALDELVEARKHQRKALNHLGGRLRTTNQRVKYRQWREWIMQLNDITNEIIAEIEERKESRQKK